MPDVSVLIASWNAEGSIGRAVGSVLAERSIDLECIVVDDGSSDGTVEAVRAAAAGDPRLVLVQLPENRGVSAARNAGLARVRGAWLSLLDADDRFRPGALATLVAAARADDSLAVVGQQVWSDGQHEWIGPLYDIPDIRRPGRKSVADAPGLLYFVSPHAKLFHRSVTEGLTFSGRVLGDQPWVIAALIRAGDRLTVIGDTVYDWIRVGPAGSGPSITATTRASVDRGVEAAGVAIEALASVRAAATEGIADVAARERVIATYVQRLLRSDLAAHIRNAAGRRDPRMGELLAAVERFVRTTRPVELASGDALATNVLQPVLRSWPAVPPDGRAAFWSLVRTARSLDPLVTTRAANPVARLALSDRGVLRRLGLAACSARGILPRRR